MPTVYACDHCHQTGTSLDGWFLVSVQFLHNDPNVPTPPGGRMLDATAPDLIFDRQECRDAWLSVAGLAVPVTR